MCKFRISITPSMIKNNEEINVLKLTNQSLLTLTEDSIIESKKGTKILFND